MVLRFVRFLAVHFGRRLGWLMLLAGLIMPAMQLYDRVTGVPAIATVTKLGSICEMKPCSGKCAWKRISCGEVAVHDAAGTRTRRTPYAQLAFQGAGGVEQSVWVNFGKLDVKHVAVGESLDILYRGKVRPYVTRPRQKRALEVGLMLSLAGGILLAVSRMLTRDKNGSRRPKPASTAATAAGRLRPKWPVRSEKSPATPVRKGPVERNTRWF
ncbi:MAG: hypothetical protein R3D68_13490 [Hyphomicrobiaceae bacterium]